MEKLLVVLGLLALLLPQAAWGQAVPTYYVDYFSDNLSEPENGLLRIINVGQGGNPLTVPTGDICANMYVFNNDQEMIECCAERITPNELAAADVFLHLTANPLTSVIPNAGVIKIVLTPAAATCNPTAAFTAPDATLGSVWGTHPQDHVGTFLFMTETEMQPRPLSTAEQTFLPMGCEFVTYLGSGRGVCTSVVPGY